ncbi:MAG TPA: hypothetical protein RMH99_01590 [Sandaracinaceae bacterium LLY-WYZ-13_1]|nr:hypothetical protein [Sandaracinaceae bacterium LLY-WYZ-13_1]
MSARWILGGLALAAVVAGCGETRRTIGEQCELDSECTAPLSCSLGNCRNTCAQSRDCDLGLTCVTDATGLGVCLLPPETTCARDDDCPGSLACRMGRCANPCEADRDCPSGARCEDVDGQPTCLDEGEDRCVDDIDCQEPRICGPFERCVVECLEDRDCPTGTACLGNRCVGDEPCRLDEDCDDGDFCNGAERCDATLPEADGRGCAPPRAPACEADELCDPEARACGPRCEVDDDLDDDGVVAAVCGGEDCDDEDPEVRPGADERCNERDDDCDEATDEGFDPSTDPAHCGACGNACSSAGGTAICVDGACDTACAAGFADCNDDPFDGCETDLTSDALHCDACGEVCPLAQACESSACVPSPIVEVAAGENHTCARRATGGVLCWGANDRGQLGNADLGPDATTPVAVLGLVDATALALGAAHSCALRADGTTVCWGANDAGQLGDGTLVDRDRPVRVRAPAGAVALAAGASHTCVREAGGLVGCWGEGADDSLAGLGPLAMATPLPGIARADALVVGARATCDRPSAGDLRCVGRVAGATLSALTEVPGTAGLEGLALARNHACGLDGGALRCWGSYVSGDRVETPEAPTGAAGRTFVEVETGIFDRVSCMRDDAGGVACLGESRHGVLGDGGDCSADATSLVDAAGVSGAVDLAVGDDHACAALADGGVRCWGLNVRGQLGDGTTDSFAACRSTPTAVEDLP